MNKQDVMNNLGLFIEEKMLEREVELEIKGKIVNKSLSRSELARRCGVSKVWMSDIINGKKSANDELLLKISDVLEINEHEIFMIARKIHPKRLKLYKKDYLGDYYIEGL